MNRYTNLFSRLADNQAGAFVPFVMLGDPDPESSEEIIRSLIESGADALELGIPFSDPVADGPVIQAAATRALAAGVTVSTCLQSIRKIRREYPEIPIGLLVYANLVYTNGVENFYRQVRDAGVDSVLVADLPLEEVDVCHQQALRHDIAPVLIAAHNTSATRLNKIAQRSHGYTYVVTRSGVTGSDSPPELQQIAGRMLEQLKQAGAPPALIGFGISEPAQVQAALNLGARGVICGSAIVRRIESHLGNTEQICATISQFVRAMKHATTLSREVERTESM